MHFKRWITSLVALPILIFLVYKGGLLFSATLAIVSGIGLWEYYQIVWPGDTRALARSISLIGILLGAVIVLGAFFQLMPLIFFVVSLSIILPAVLFLKPFDPNEDVPRFLALHVMGVMYVPFSLALMTVIRSTENGMAWIFMILCVVFAGDTGAYYAGRYLGKRKLCPNVSPGKTVVGAMGGLAANLVVILAGKSFWLPGTDWVTVSLLAIAIGIAGQVGDLFESMLKRSSGVKDSGHLLPGHGGVLDRIDALLFAVPMAYVILVHFLN